MTGKNVLSVEDYEICNKLKSMRFSGMAEALQIQMQNFSHSEKKYSVSWMQSGIYVIPRS